MKKKIAALCLAFLMCVPLFGGVAFAARNAALVVDEVGLLSVSELDALNLKAEDVSAIYGCELSIWITRQAPIGYVDAIYAQHGYGGDDAGTALILVIDAEEGLYDYGSYGRAFVLTEDEKFEAVVETLIPDYENGNYFDAFNEYLNACDMELYIELGSLAGVGEDVPELIPGYPRGKKPPILLDTTGALSMEVMEEQAYASDKGIDMRIDTESDLWEKLAYLGSMFQTEVSVLLLQNTNGIDVAEHAAEIYQSNNYGLGAKKSGILLLISVDDGECAVAVFGGAQELISEYDIALLKQTVSALTKSSQNVKCIMKFLEELEFYLADETEYGLVPGYVYGAKPPLVTDKASVLTEAQLKALNKQADAIAKEYDCEVSVLFLQDMGGGKARDNAMDIYEFHNYGAGSKRSGMLLLVSMMYNDFAMAAFGYGNVAFTDYGKEKIEEAFRPLFSAGDFNGGVQAYLDICEQYLEIAANGEPFDRDTDPARTAAMLAMKVGGSAFAGLLVALIVCMVWKSQMKTAKKQSTANAYILKNGFKLTAQNDMFLYRTTRTRRIESSSSSGRGGGSSVNSRGFSGRSGKF